MKNYKIRNIKIENHPILGDLYLDFCDKDGRAVDTIIIAGENGSGKSTLLNILFKLTCGQIVGFDGLNIVQVEFERDGNNNTFEMESRSEGKWVQVTDTKKKFFTLGDAEFVKQYNFAAIYSDVDINFDGKNIQSVTSIDVDITEGSRRSSSNLATEIKQLLIDIKAMDAEDFTNEFNSTKSKGEDTNALIAEKRISRFSNAFNFMFEGLRFEKIENKIGYKDIIFANGDSHISIDDLSSGEKQIVYRNSFLLKDKHALSGAFVFIDEPEISLHPKWQEKILDNYKKIFSDDKNNQTSQIFVVTHSPFIIHNEYRKNDKVIILKKNADGKISVIDKPEYYKCDSVEAVEDAFDFKLLNDKSYVCLAGRTDEMYFKKCIEVFGYTDLPFEFKWVGHLDSQGNEGNSGDSALQKAYHFLASGVVERKIVLLYDGDAKKKDEQSGNVFVRGIKYYEHGNRFKKGIENALLIDEELFNFDDFYRKNETVGDYGEPKSNPKFLKMDFCQHVCSLPDEALKIVFENLNIEIKKLIEFFKA